MKNKITLLFIFLLLLSVSCSETEQYKSVKEKEFTELSQQDNTVILDVRTPEEYREGHLENATLLDFNSENFEKEIDLLDKSKTYLVYCKAGGRSAKASQLMSNKGFKVVNLEGGYSCWTGKTEK